MAESSWERFPALVLMAREGGRRGGGFCVTRAEYR